MLARLHQAWNCRSRAGGQKASRAKGEVQKSSKYGTPYCPAGNATCVTTGSRWRKLLKATRIRRTVTIPALGVLLASLFTLGAGATASASSVGIQAHPTDCTFSIADAWRTIAKCNKSNGGSYRAIAVCKDSEGRVTHPVGQWRRDGGFSIAYCPGSGKPTSAGVETRHN